MPIRLTYFFAFFITCALLGFSIYLETYQNFVPCPLCMLQRFVFVFLGILFLIGLFIARTRALHVLVSSLALLGSVLGLLLSGRQVWLQFFPPPENTECGASLQYLLQTLSLQDVLHKVYAGTAECSQPGWDFLGISMAQWSFLWFLFFFIISFYLLKKKA